jgi:hypothetical protein
MKNRGLLSMNGALSFVRAGKDAHALRQFNFMNQGQPASVGKLMD